MYNTPYNRVLRHSHCWILHRVVIALICVWEGVLFTWLFTSLDIKQKKDKMTTSRSCNFNNDSGSFDPWINEESEILTEDIDLVMVILSCMAVSLWNHISIMCTDLRCQLFTETRVQSYLCEVKVEQTEGEELQADGAAVEQPVGQRLQLVGLHHVFKVKREEGRPERCPQQAQEQKHTLVAEALVSVVQNEPELQVHENKQERGEGRVDASETELQCWGDRSSCGLLQRGKQMGIYLLSCRKHLHWLLTLTWDAVTSDTPELWQTWVKFSVYNKKMRESEWKTAIKAFYSGKKWHRGTAQGFKCDSGLRRNVGLVVKKRRKVKMKTERKKTREVPCESLQSCSAKKQLEGEETSRSAVMYF